MKSNINQSLNKVNYSRWSAGLFILFILSIASCEYGFDLIEIGEDNLPPGEVRNLRTTTGDGTVTLNWTAPIDYDLAGYVVTYMPNGIDEIQLDIVNQLVVESLENGVEYTFTISTVDGVGNISEGISISATPGIDIGPPLVSFTESFNFSCPSGLPDGWLSFSVSSNTEWECVDPQSDGNYALQGNNFGADVPADDWLITPAIDFPVGHGAILNFKYSAEFSDMAGFGLGVSISTDYSGSGNPNNATWTTLDAGINNSLGSNALTNSTPVTLASYSGIIYVAFRYTSSGTGGGSTLRARIDDVSIEEPVLMNFPFTENFDTSCPAGLPNGWLSFSESNNTEWECVDPQSDGNFALQGNNFGANMAANDWLITPGIELPVSNSAFLGFKYSAEFSDMAGFGLGVKISTNYSGSGDPNNATWIPLDAGINNSLSSNTLTNSTPVSLASYSGVIYVAFRYTSSGTGGGSTLRARVDEVSIAEPELMNFPFTENFDTSCPAGLPNGWLSFSESNNTEWECVDPQSDGNFALQGNNFGADMAANDWLITPGIELPASNSAFLGFKYSAEFSDMAGFGLSVKISTNYSGSGDPSNATWIPLDAGINNSLSSNTLTNSTPVPLSAYSGLVYVAFRYMSSGTGGGSTLRARIDDISVE